MDDKTIAENAAGSDAYSINDVPAGLHTFTIALPGEYELAYVIASFDGKDILATREGKTVRVDIPAANPPYDAAYNQYSSAHSLSLTWYIRKYVPPVAPSSPGLFNASMKIIVSTPTTARVTDYRQGDIAGTFAGVPFSNPAGTGEFNFSGDLGAQTTGTYRLTFTAFPFNAGIQSGRITVVSRNEAARTVPVEVYCDGSMRFTIDRPVISMGVEIYATKDGMPNCLPVASSSRSSATASVRSSSSPGIASPAFPTTIQGYRYISGTTDITTLHDANVTLLVDQLITASNAGNNVYAIENIRPGSYILNIQAPGYNVTDVVACFDTLTRNDADARCSHPTLNRSTLVLEIPNKALPTGAPYGQRHVMTLLWYLTPVASSSNASAGASPPTASASSRSAANAASSFAWSSAAAVLPPPLPPPALGLPLPTRAALETASCSRLEGWACDQRNLATPALVSLYDGQPGAGGIFIGYIIADASRSASPVCSGPNHGFSIPMPAVLKDGRSHSLWLHFHEPNAGNDVPFSDMPVMLSCKPS